MQTVVTINGTVYGNLWMPHARGFKSTLSTFRLDRKDGDIGPYSTVRSIREAVEKVCQHEGGDFRGGLAKLTGDSVIKIQTGELDATGAVTIRRRIYFAERFSAALADYVDPDVLSCDAVDDEG